MKASILFVFHGNNTNSGATKSLLDIVKYLAATNDYTIYAVVPFAKGNLAPYLEGLGIETKIFRYGDLICDLNTTLIRQILRFPLFPLRHIRIIGEARKAAEYYRSKNIDVVYTNTSTVLFGGILGNLIHAKNIWHIREFGLMDHKIRFYLGEKYIDTYIEDNAAAVCCVSEAVKQYHSRYIDKNKMHVTYNSYPKSFIFRRDLFNFSSTLQILIAGDIKSGKGQLAAVDAVKLLNEKYPNRIMLHIAGKETDKRYSKHLHNIVIENNLESIVHFYGQVEDMYTLRKSMDVGIVSSENEAFGRTTIEGMLSSMCMIGRKSGGTIEQIDDGKTGLLYDGSAENLANIIEKVFIDRQMMKELAINGHHEAVEKYTNNNAAKTSNYVIERVLEEK